MNQRLASVYIYYGDDEFPVTTRAHEQVDALVPEAERMMSLETLDGRADSTEAALRILRQTLSALKTSGFFGGRRVVWLKDTNLFSDRAGGWSEEVKALIQEVTTLIEAGLPESHTLVVTAPKIDGRQKFLKVCKAIGKVEEFAMPEKSWAADQQALPRIREAFRAEGLTAAEDVTAVFLEKVGVDSRQIANEVAKLVLWMDSRKTVTLADIEAVTVASRGRMAWDWTEAVMERKTSRALILLRQLLAQKTSEVWMISLLADRINELLIFREALDRKWALLQPGQRGGLQWQSLAPAVETALAGDVVKDPRKMHPYRAGLLARQAGEWTRRDLERARRETLGVYEQLLSGGLGAELLLSFLTLRIGRLAVGVNVGSAVSR
jgi:DNA polymerase III delta subunit